MKYDTNQLRAAATAIANARAGRHGMPDIKNVLMAIPKHLVDEVMEDAGAALEAVESAPSASTNARYATALAVFEEFLESSDGGVQGPFLSYCRERLNASHSA